MEIDSEYQIGNGPDRIQRTAGEVPACSVADAVEEAAVAAAVRRWVFGSAALVILFIWWALFH